jgi:peroxisomal coenzyme A diphosphatase NUDT7
LPLDSPHIYNLCRLRTFLSAFRLLVTPVVVFLSDPSLLEHLNMNPSEVDHIFDWPFEAILQPELLREEEDTLVPRGSNDWFYDKEFHVR